MNAVFDQAQIQINRDRTCRPCSDHTSLRAACSPTCKAPHRSAKCLASALGWGRRPGCAQPIAPNVLTLRSSAPTMPSSDNGISMRTIVDLPEAERAQLDALCRQRGLSRAEALRQALRLWLDQQKPSHGEVFGLWRDRPEGALELQQALRQEWAAR